MRNSEDTIYAPSTAIGGAIAVLRVSGPRAKETARIFDRGFASEPGMMRFVRVQDDKEPIDDAMAVYFSAPASYTGEDMVEIDCHGGHQTVQRILGLLSGLGFRPAEGGEFTRRAFLNGKMDLAQAEAVMDIITADAEQSRKAALNQLHGSVSRAIHDVEDVLLDALSGIDAAIDYPDEAEEDCIARLPEQLGAGRSKAERLLADGRRGRVLRDGLRVVILGRPNTGKSSLMNALAGFERAIVTDIAGTTRDVLDERLSFDGVPVRLIDTAGIREATDRAEQIGVDRALDEMRRADVQLVLLDGSAPLTTEDETLIETTENGIPRILVVNKCDLPRQTDYAGAISISAKTGQGLEELKREVLRLAAPQDADCNAITNERHLHALEQACAALCSAEQAEELDCKATDIRAALQALGSITGTDVDATVIDRIFERFCVGK
ncbi:tRNA modification GTPase MnmE [Clostridium sp. CAG:1024]|nr:tRNA uridine-5-carboxymethylaminomethyl(34) synthesis GTPase MnmE [Eubacteriales bacterium]CCX41127.1 tRNA modification GTPase MnmE [Clostridium sp. CAG:1024]